MASYKETKTQSLDRLFDKGSSDPAISKWLELLSTVKGKGVAIDEYIGILSEAFDEENLTESLELSEGPDPEILLHQAFNQQMDLESLSKKDRKQVFRVWSRNPKFLHLFTFLHDQRLELQRFKQKLELGKRKINSKWYLAFGLVGSLFAKWSLGNFVMGSLGVISALLIAVASMQLFTVDKMPTLEENKNIIQTQIVTNKIKTKVPPPKLKKTSPPQIPVKHQFSFFSPESWQERSFIVVETIQIYQNNQYVQKRSFSNIISESVGNEVDGKQRVQVRTETYRLRKDRPDLLENRLSSKYYRDRQGRLYQSENQAYPNTLNFPLFPEAPVQTGSSWQARCIIKLHDLSPMVRLQPMVAYKLLGKEKDHLLKISFSYKSEADIESFYQSQPVRSLKIESSGYFLWNTSRHQIDYQVTESTERFLLENNDEIVIKRRSELQ